MSVKSKQSTSKKDKLKKKEKRKKLEESEEDLESSEEELDLTKKCHPIGYYLNDRAEMINQMFSVIKGNKLRAMLPPILKDCDIEQLKLQCLDQLLGMSEKRITCILEGEILETSSESDVPESDEGDSDEKNGTSSGSSSEKSKNESPEREDSVNGSENRRKKGKRKSETPNRTVATAPAAPEKGKTLLEILELEMRARAIRALLKQGGHENANEAEAKASDANQNGVKDAGGEIVDLTEGDDEELLPPIIKKEVVETDIDKKVSKFEEKIEKSQSAEKTNQTQEDQKAKRLQAELELRNKLFKKKIYRTRQQRMENDEDDEKRHQHKNEEEKRGISLKNVLIKQEPTEPDELVIEDPEEGEVSTSEDEYPVEIKQEVVEPEVPEPQEEQAEFQAELDDDAQRICAIDNGNFVNEQVEDTCEQMNADSTSLVLEASDAEANDDLEDKKMEEAPAKEAETEENSQAEAEIAKESEDITESSEPPVEESSWRDRWLQKDGVQKIVKSSKILAKVKKRMKKMDEEKRKEESAPVTDEVNSDSNSNPVVKMDVVEGSIEEYERLSSRLPEKPKQKDEVVSETSNQESQEVEAEATRDG